MEENKVVKHFTDSIYYELERTARVLKMLGIQVFEKIDASLGPDEHAALDTISYNPCICQRDLAKLILKDRANTGKILNSLEEKGLIERFVDTKNNRLVRKTRITPKGELTIKELNAKLEQLFNEIQVSSKINHGEIDAVQASLKKLRTSFEEIVNMKI